MVRDQPKKASLKCFNTILQPIACFNNLAEVSLQKGSVIVDINAHARKLQQAVATYFLPVFW